jgi:hypothetical protein
MTYTTTATSNASYSTILMEQRTKTNWVQTNQTMYKLDVTGFGLAETNTTFRGQFYQKWHDVSRKAFQPSKMISSENDITYNNAYKPDEMLCIQLTNRLKSKVPIQHGHKNGNFCKSINVTQTQSNVFATI